MISLLVIVFIVACFAGLPILKRCMLSLNSWFLLADHLPQNVRPLSGVQKPPEGPSNVYRKSDSI